MDAKDRDGLAAHFGNMASEAGKIIMSCRSPAMSVERKPDGSPVSDADTRAEKLIRERLGEILPGIPVIAEESFEAGNARRADRFVLVDPLDGTREFISGSDEFTVNIALVEHGQPTVGCVYAPASNQLYLAGAAALRTELSPGSVLPALGNMMLLVTRPYVDEGLCALASRSHLDTESEALLQSLPVSERRLIGSSLKFCLIAQGDGDIYPRLAPTMEWDTAAGQSILTAAGGCVIGRDGSPLRYGKIEAGFRNNGFVAWGRTPLP